MWKNKAAKLGQAEYRGPAAVVTPIDPPQCPLSAKRAKTASIFLPNSAPAGQGRNRGPKRPTRRNNAFT